ncbi:MAG TPA: A/G-specific adenine glycosylase [Saprospiraceae bacterium]|nr:A/G-specific adenine glycosylase [Saprospiraceae bacterium]
MIREKNRDPQLITAKAFSRTLLEWSAQHPRTHPWIGESDPYKIWISEIMLQQTRSDQAEPYYRRFLKRFPSIQELSRAPIDEVLLVWKGLGYYTRARNLHAASKQLVQNHGGRFPVRYEELIKLKGIGMYTAAAISSFAFGEARAVVDGNVVRFLSRLFGMAESFHGPEGKRIFQIQAQSLLDPAHAARHNQAIMDFGATVCRPHNPECHRCPFRDSCQAFQQDRIPEFPVKKIRKALKKRYLHYFLLYDVKGCIAIRKREDKDIWQELYELPGVETRRNLILKSSEALASYSSPFEKKRSTKILPLTVEKQKLSHQEISIRFYVIRNTGLRAKIKPLFSFVKPENLVNFAFPKVIGAFLHKHLS